MNSFKDKNGLDWTPFFSIRAIREFHRETGLELKDLQGEKLQDIEVLSAMLWFSSITQAIPRNITREQFEELFGYAELTLALPIMLGTYAERTYPKPDDSEAGNSGSPLDLGKIAISWN